MADIYLDVPFVSQLNIGCHAGVGRDETNGCWYATCCTGCRHRINSCGSRSSQKAHKCRFLYKQIKDYKGAGITFSASQTPGTW